LITAAKGLEDVVAADTSICFIDGKLGRLVYRGYSIDDLCKGSFEETAFLLLYGALPTRAQLDSFMASLVAARSLDPLIKKFIKALPRNARPMSALISCTALLGILDPERDDISVEATRRKAARLIGIFPSLIAAFHRTRIGEEMIEPEKGNSHAHNLLYMLKGEEPDKEDERALDIALILHADHELNASTFVARTAASTLSDIHSAVVAALATLKGPLHGGANERVMETLMKIGSKNNAERFILDALEQKKRVPGFGHRVYKTMDPRAAILKKLSKERSAARNQSEWFEISEIIERVMLAQRKLYPNVDFYSATLYSALGIPRDLFTPLFAASRVAGQAAHIIEQYMDNRLIRPLGNYTGPTDLKYIPIEER